MQFLNNMKVGQKIILLVSMLLVLLALIAGVAIIQMEEISGETSAMYNNNVLALTAAKEANIQLIGLSRSVRNLILVTPDMRPNYVNGYNNYVVRLKEELAKVEALLLTQKAKDIYRKTVAAVDAMLPQLQSIVDNINSMNSEQLLNALVKVRGYTNTADDLMTDLGVFVADAAKGRSVRIATITDDSFKLIVGALIAALLLGMSLGMMIKKAIANPLVAIAGKATQVAGGDLGQEFALKRNDELGTLATALQHMVENLRARIAEAEQKSREAEEQSRKAQEATVEAHAAKEKAEAGQQAILAAAAQVDQVVTRLSAATEELSAQIEQSSRSTDLQHDRVSQSATAMEEMNSTVMEVAKNAGIAAQGSDKAREKADQGAGIVKESVLSIGVVQKDTEVLRDNMEELGRQAEAIGTIMTVISDIADQTNLLALNAAIEAARAGEAGRGFAVVADEVRKLAEKTMQATKEVGDAIGGIQTGTRQSIAAVENTTHNLNNTTTLVQRSGEALSNIVSEVNSTASQVSSIATAAEEQSSASEEIARSLDEINHMATENATAMQQSAQAVSELAHQTQELQTLVNNLRRTDGKS